ncbi:MAG: hypothetical protein JXB07_04435 [Anaerolineae bacterium]|nr:hypothetical protein [Anaerolineae bacterium]
MDDDLMSLRSNVSSAKNDDDDLLGSFGNIAGLDDDVGAGDPSNIDLDFGSLDDQPEWLRDLGVQPEESAPVEQPAKQEKKEKKKKKSVRRSRKSSGNFMGLTPQQRLILALFLFLEVAVISIFVLMATGAISLPSF